MRGPHERMQRYDRTIRGGELIYAESDANLDEKRGQRQNVD